LIQNATKVEVLTVRKYAETIQVRLERALNLDEITGNAVAAMLN
jgi:hypothetical protein